MHLGIDCCSLLAIVMQMCPLKSDLLKCNIWEEEKSAVDENIITL